MIIGANFIDLFNIAYESGSGRAGSYQIIHLIRQEIYSILCASRCFISQWLIAIINTP